MQIKTTMRYHFTLVRIAIIKKPTNKCWRECEEKRTLLHYWWECKLVWPLRKQYRISLEKTKNRVSIWSSNPTSGHISRKDRNSNLKRYMHPSVHRTLFTITRTWKQPKCPTTDDWLKKMWHIYTRMHTLMHTHTHTHTHTMECCSATKRHIVICSNIDKHREYYT